MEAVLNHAERSLELGTMSRPAKLARTRKSMETLREPRGEWQERLRRYMLSSACDAVVASVIVSNIVVMCFEADRNAYCPEGENCAGDFIDTLNLLFTIFYTIEVVVRILAFECTVFKDVWNMLDIAVVILGWVERVFRSLGFGFNLLRLFRVTRLVRASRFLHLFPELHMMVAGFFKAMMAMFWGSFMIFCLLLVFALLAVELVHPENTRIEHKDAACLHAYSSVWRAIITFFQTIVAGDSWGHCSLELIHTNKLMFVPLALAFVFVQLGSMNLILSVIVDSASKAREEDKEEKERLKLVKRQEAADQLFHLLEEIDLDGSGTISYEEFHAGYVSNANLRQLVHDMKLGVDDLRVLLDVMDTSREGTVSYKAFVEFLQNSSTEQLQQNILIARLVKRREDAFEALVAQITGIHMSESRSVLHGGTKLLHDNDMAGDKQPQSPVVKMNEIAATRSMSRGESSASTSGVPPLTPVHETSGDDQTLHESPQRLSQTNASPVESGTRAAMPADMVSEYAQKLALCHAQFSHMLEKIVSEFDKLSKNIQAVSVPDGVQRGSHKYRHESVDLFSVSETGAVVGSSRPLAAAGDHGVSPEKEPATRPWFRQWSSLNPNPAQGRGAVKTICCVEVPVKSSMESETVVVREVDGEQPAGGAGVIATGDHLKGQVTGSGGSRSGKPSESAGQQSRVESTFI